MKKMSVTKITRRQLPAYEKNGCVALELYGDLISVILHQARVDYETEFGVAVDIPHEYRELKSGVNDTIFLGNIWPDGKIRILDILMLDKKSQRGKTWMIRRKIMESFFASSKLGKEFKEKVVLTIPKDRSLVRLYDNVLARQGKGLFLRTEKKKEIILCVEDG